MDLALSIIALVLGIIGLVGVFVTGLPGTLFSYAGLICVYFNEDTTVTMTQLIICLVLTIVVMVLDYALPGYFSKIFGGTKYGIWGATIGTFVGLFFGPWGIILGPFVGAVVGELIGKKMSFWQAVKVGFGSMLAFFATTGIKLLIGLYLFYYIVKELIHVIFNIISC